MYNMKKLILLLLISGGLSAQVVVPKSTTTFSNVNAVGSMTVGGNLRVTGSETITGQAKLSNTLNIIGNTTINSNQTNTLTTGNTGTVAVLSDAVFAVNCMAVATTPADATTYYFGNTPGTWSTLQGNGKVYMPYNATFVGWSFNGLPNGSYGSAENATLSIGIDNSYTVLNSSITFSANTTYSATANTNINAGSYYEARLQCPTWVTNPPNTSIGITFWFVRRQ